MNVTPIDLHFQGHPECIAAFLLESEGEHALVESGPGSTLETLIGSLEEKGVSPGDISQVFLTHIHLDHAGAAGWWAQQGAQLYVHERGARHLIDPSKLIEGARAVYGDALEQLWGEILPAPEQNVTVLQDGEKVDFGSASLIAWDTPGHARHHLTFLADGVAFTGDVAGARLPGCSHLSPTTAPSQFDPEAYAASIQRLQQAGLETLYLTHFGPIHDVADHLERYQDLIARASELVREQLEDPVPAFTEFNRSRARADGLSESDWERYEAANPSSMCAAGIQLYWQRQRKQN